MMIRTTYFALLVLAASDLSAATINAANCSSAAVQIAIDAAQNGDTVRVASASSVTWTTSVVMSANKYITLDLNRCTITLSGSSGRFAIHAHSSGNNRVTNGTFIRGSGFDLYSAPFEINDSPTGAPVRVDHITFSGNNVLVDITGRGAGLLDNCQFIGLRFAQEFIHIMGWGATNTTGWTTGVDVGGRGLFYIEDNTFTAATNQGGVAWIQGYYGARVVIRHNIFDHVSIDMHGSGGAVGARWWEIYENTWRNTVNGTSGGWAASMRAGSGVIFGNTDLDGRYDIGLCEEDSGYPASFQIGRGTNQSSDPVYVWGNSSNMSLDLNACDAPEVPGMVQLNRDVFASAKSGYAPQAYPHFLVTGTAPPAPSPMPPSNLTVNP